MNYYQTIPELEITGRMNTPEEFDNIGLPRNLIGWSVMDIGCNIGAFLIECHKRGAMKLLGVEVNSDYRRQAKDVFSKLGIKARFVEKEQEKSDLVLLLSVLHVTESDPQELLDRAWNNTERILIVEINDRLQDREIKLPKEARFYGKNKDNRSVYICTKSN